MGFSLATALAAKGIPVRAPIEQGKLTLGDVCSGFGSDELAPIAALPEDFKSCAFRKWPFATFCRTLKEVLLRRLERGKKGDRTSHLTRDNLQGVLSLVIWHRQKASPAERKLFDSLYSRLTGLEGRFDDLRALRLLQRVIDLL